jgi:hypothetical protein
MTWLRGILQPLSQRGNQDKVTEAVRLAEADAEQGAPAEQALATGPAEQ